MLQPAATNKEIDPKKYLVISADFCAIWGGNQGKGKDILTNNSKVKFPTTLFMKKNNIL